jgi:arylsulfatase/uncharacterized sulfatase
MLAPADEKWVRSMQHATGRSQPKVLGSVIAAFSALAIALAASDARAQGAGPGPTSSRPNIVIFLADDWGFTDVGSFGGEIATPNIDALAATGIRFSNFHTAASCAPTRAMLQTGVNNHRAGLGNMPETIPREHVGKRGYETVLSDRVVTLATRLRDSGYRTYFTGKWHLGRTLDTLPNAHGYDRSVALGDTGADNFEQRPIEGLYAKADWTEDGGPVTLPADYYSSRFLVDKMIQYVEDGRGRGEKKPFFASVNFLANHIPVQAPDEFIARYATKYDAGWTVLRQARRDRAASLGLVPIDTPITTMSTTKDWSALRPSERSARARAMAAYGGMAEALDHEVGRFIAHLKASGDFDNTIIVFLSDNGAEPFDPMAGTLGALTARRYYDVRPEQQGRRGSLTAIGPSWASAASSPLDGYKFSASEGGLRVPLIISWSGNPDFKRGRIMSRFTHVTDIAPTLLDLAGLDLSAARKTEYRGRTVEALRGASLVPVLTGRADAAHPDDRPLGYEFSGNAALFKGDFKLVRNLPPLGDGKWRLFDIVRDPGETRDLSAAMPERYAAMQRDYEAYAREDGVLPMPAGYSSDRQIMRSALVNTLLPSVAKFLAALIGIIVASIVAWRLIRQRRA